MTCSRESHARAKRDTAEWRATTMPLGVQRFDDGGPPLELRNCRCGTTLARELHEGDDAYATDLR